MKLTKIFMIAALAATLVSCGGNEKKQEKKEFEPVTVEATLYKGESISKSSSCSTEVSDYLAIDTENGDKIEIKAEKEDYLIAVKAKVPIKVLKPVENMGSYFSFALELLDADNEYVTSLSPNSADKETLENALKKGTPEVVEVSFKGTILEYDVDKLEKVKYYRLRNVSFDTASSSSSSSNDDSDVSSSSSSSSSVSSYGSDDNDDDDNGSVSSSSSSNDWDALLDDYERYVDDMISLVNKVKAGDPTVMAEYSAAVSDAQEISNKLAKAKGTMTAAQINRYNKLMAKYTKALM